MKEIRIVLDAPWMGSEPAHFVGIEDERGEPFPLGGYGSTQRADGNFHLTIDPVRFLLGHAFTTVSDARNSVTSMLFTVGDLESRAAARIPPEEKARAHALLEEGATRVAEAIDILAWGIEGE